MKNVWSLGWLAWTGGCFYLCWNEMVRSFHIPITHSCADIGRTAVGAGYSTVFVNRCLRCEVRYWGEAAFRSVSSLLPCAGRPSCRSCHFVNLCPIEGTARSRTTSICIMYMYVRFAKLNVRSPIYHRPATFESFFLQDYTITLALHVLLYVSVRYW